MLDCWSTDPARRPTMRMTIVEMDSIMEDDQVRNIIKRNICKEFMKFMNK